MSKSSSRVREDLLGDYLRRAEAWEDQVYRNLAASRLRAWIVAAVSAGVALLSLLALVLALPLKEFAPFVISVDKSTGYAEVVRELAATPISGEEAVTEANLVAWIIDRETYDPADIKPRFEQMRLTSAGRAWEDYRALWAPGGPQNPGLLYGWNARIRVEVKAISFLRPDVASIRFRKLETDSRSGETRISDWVGIVGFAYARAPMRMRERWSNPLGFQVTSYRADQEALATPPAAAVASLALQAEETP